MEHLDSIVEVLNWNGSKKGYKKCSEIDKAKDIFKTVQILLFNPKGDLFITKIPGNDLYGGKLGSSAAGIVQRGENYDVCADRTLRRELGIDGLDLRLREYGPIELEDGVRRYTAVFTAVYDGKLDGGQFYPQKNLTEMINSNRKQFAPTFLAAYELI